ncbi:MAG: NAD-dependent succinate-semialdehyde dehydrogenase [Verrucomicrobiota bacterium]
MLVTTSSLENYCVIDPSTGDALESYSNHSAAEIDKALEASTLAFESWKRTSYGARAELLNKVASKLREEKSVLAGAMAIEMGKPIGIGEAEAEKCAFVLEYYAENGESFLQSYTAEAGFRESYVTYRPLGPIFGIMPWNFPLWQVFRACAPILMAGNTFVLKHAPRVPRTALAIERIFLEAGFPAGVVRNVFADNQQAADIIASPAIKGVCLTGSERAGSAVASTAGRHLKKVLLELGGSDPYIVLEDADLDLAANKTATSRMLNNGQTCISAKRFIVVDAVADAFADKMIAELKAYKMGHPTEEGVNQGPVSREDLRRQLSDQVDRSVEAGAGVLLGGKPHDGDGFFYPATLLDEVGVDSPAFNEELFGPVGSIIRVRDEKEAIQLSNATSLGLGGAVFTQDIDRGKRIAEEEIEVGTCVVNDFVRSDPRLPFGGINRSGFGRELGAEGIREFVNIKTVCVG